MSLFARKFFPCAGENKRTRTFIAMNVRGNEATDIGYYVLDGDLKLRRVEDAKAQRGADVVGADGSPRPALFRARYDFTIRAPAVS